MSFNGGDQQYYTVDSMDGIDEESHAADDDANLDEYEMVSTFLDECYLSCFSFQN